MGFLRPLQFIQPVANESGKRNSVRKWVQWVFFFAHIERLSLFFTHWVAVMGVDLDNENQPWYYERLQDLQHEGWNISSIEEFLSENEDLASERLVYTDFTVELAQELLERTGYLGESVDSRSLELSRAWEEELRDPMNAERVQEEYRLWALDWRPWELELHRGEEQWRDAGLENELASIIARFDALDASSLPSAKILSPILHSPENYDEIIDSLSAIELDEKRQRDAVSNAAKRLSKAGFDVGNVGQMPIIDALDWITQLHELHDLHEELRLLILEQIAIFDPGLAEHHEVRRIDLIQGVSTEELRNFRIQMDAIADNLHQRLARLNDLLNEWRAKGIEFPHGDSIRPEELLEWETNLPEIEKTLHLHLTALERWSQITSLWEDIEHSGSQYAGKLEQTEQFIDYVDLLDQQWKQYEIEAMMFIENYEHQGLIMLDWNEEIVRDPRSALNMLKKKQHLFELRVACIGKLSNLDTSFESKNEVSERINLLKEIDVDLELLDNTSEFIENLARRGARHRRMLESDWRRLIADGKANESTNTASFTLLDFENEIAHIQRHGMGSSVLKFGGSLVAGSIHERLKSRTRQELTLLLSAGWEVHNLLEAVEDEPVIVAQKINSARDSIRNFASLKRRISRLHWHRDVTLALEVQQQLRDPTQLSALVESIPQLTKHLAKRPIEDEDFVFESWTPDLTRRTLVPVPEHSERYQTMVPKDAMEDAYEAILEAVEERVEEENVEAPKKKDKKDLPAQNKPIGSESESEVITEKDVKIRPHNTVSTANDQNEDMPTEASIKKVNDESKSRISPNSTDESSKEVLDNIVHFLRTIQLEKLANQLSTNGESALDNVRRSLAQHVGISPRDTRIDRMLRLSLRLLPQNDDYDVIKSKMLAHIGDNTKNIQRWMRVRLEHRHSGSNDNFLEDALRLGKALQRIPGPGFPLPTKADVYELPDPNDVEGLNKEVSNLIAHLNMPTAGGIIA